MRANEKAPLMGIYYKTKKWHRVDKTHVPPCKCGLFYKTLRLVLFDKKPYCDKCYQFAYFQMEPPAAILLCLK